MHLHLVGGFLGSGKTTAIIAAAKALMLRGKTVGVVTNDQGKYLVDTAFFRLNAVPAVEVTGGCFCCNYDDLEQRLDQLQSQLAPDVIFAESVGSCGDLVATVVKPLQRLRQADLGPSSFSVFTDARLLQARLSGEELPFSENVVYIFDQQIEEAPLLVLNKADLLTTEEAAGVERLARLHYPEKTVRLQSALDPQGIAGWLEQIESGEAVLPSRSLDMDYRRYGDGEAHLAWLDAEIDLQAPDGRLREAVLEVISRIVAEIRREGAAIGHVKFLVTAGDSQVKISIPTLEQPGWQAALRSLTGLRAALLVNARVEMAPERLRSLVREALERAAAGTQALFREVKMDCFQPGFPNPTHRVTA